MAILNRRARHEYHILETFEAGIMLTGPEVKSIRLGQANLAEAHCIIRNRRVLLIGCHISPYKPAAMNNPGDPTRSRELLLQMAGELAHRGPDGIGLYLDGHVGMVNTRLSPKALLFPQSEVMLEYSLDETRDDHHIMKEVARDDSPRAVVGIRPCDAKATLLVKLNIDTPDVKDPYWLAAYQATTFVGMACDTPLSTCFCTTAGCGPYHEEGLDVLVMDRGDAYLAKILTDKGKAFADAAKRAGIEHFVYTSVAKATLDTGVHAGFTRHAPGAPTSPLRRNQFRRPCRNDPPRSVY